MNKSKKTSTNLILWTPRVLALALNAFLALFALDVFSEGYNFVEMFIGLFMHLVPNLILATTTFIAWKKPLIGAYLFAGLAILTGIFFTSYKHPGTFAITTAPLLLISLLFSLSHSKTTK